MNRSVDWLKKLTNYFAHTKRFERYLKDVNPVLVDNGKIKAEFVVTEDHVDMQRQLHGGLTATLFDVLSSFPLIFYKDGFTGVSVNIHITYVKPAFPGDVLIIDAKICRVEHPLAYLEMELLRKNGDIVAHGQHTFFMKPYNQDAF